MLFFLTSRLRQWLLFAVAVPLLLILVRLVRQTLERRSGESRLTGTLLRVEELGQRKRNRPRR